MKNKTQKRNSKPPPPPKAGRKRTFSVTACTRRSHEQDGIVMKIKLPHDLNGKKLSTGLRCPKGMLNTKTWEIKHNSVDTEILRTMRQNISRAYLECLASGKRPKYEHLFDAAFGNTNRNKVTVIQAIERYFGKEYLSEISEWSPLTTKKNMHQVTVLKEFFKDKFKGQEVDFEDLNPQTADDIIFWCKSKRNHTTDTAGRVVKFLRRIINYSIANNWTTINPLLSFKFKAGHKFIIALTEDEIKAIMELELRGENLILTRDLFVFCIFTCISYIDLKNLKYGNVQEIKSEKVIILNRQKLGNSRSFIPILPESQEILDKYKPDKIKSDTPCFPVPANQTMNLVLKELGAMAEIEKKLTCHVGRKSGSTYLLNRGVPIEIVQKICGHQSVTVTQKHYAALHDESILREIRKMKERNGS